MAALRVSGLHKTQSDRNILRSMLFAPATHQHRLQKARDSKADAVVADLEDSVAVSEKQVARASIKAYLDSRARVWPLHFVRINGLATGWAFADLEAVVFSGLDGIMLPKTEAAAQVQAIQLVLEHLEQERGLEPGVIEILPSIETALGLQSAYSIATSSPRIRRLNFGAGDFSLDTGGMWLATNQALTFGRAQVLVACRSAPLQGPIDSAFPAIRDETGLLGEAQLVREMGYTGKVCIHPDQVAVVNAVFTPSPGEVEAAQRIVEAFDRAEADGAAAITVDGKLVDYPVARRARRLINDTAAISSRSSEPPLR